MKNSSMLSSNIRKLAKQNNISIKQFLNECSLNRNFMYDIEHKSQPGIDKLQKIADYFKVSVDYLLGNEPSTSPSSISGTSIIITRNGSQTAYSVSDSTADAVEELLKNLTK